MHGRGDSPVNVAGSAKASQVWYCKSDTEAMAEEILHRRDDRVLVGTGDVIWHLLLHQRGRLH